MFAHLDGSLRCTECPVGTFSAESGASSCKACASGFFNDAPRQSVCKACPAGFISDAGASECAQCRTKYGETSNTLGTNCSSYIAMYYRDPFDESCILCPSHATCPEHSQVTDWILDKGYWRSSIYAADVYACQFGSIACPGMGSSCADNTSSYCACGYEGPLCSSCSSDFFLSWWGGTCVDCLHFQEHRPSIFLGGVFLTCVLALTGALHLCRERFGKLGIGKRAKRIYLAGKAKFKLIFFGWQGQSLVMRLSLYFTLR